MEKIEDIVIFSLREIKKITFYICEYLMKIILAPPHIKLISSFFMCLVFSSTSLILTRTSALDSKLSFG